jgi:hypothetical protein
MLYIKTTMRSVEHRGGVPFKGEGIVTPMFPQIVNIIIICEQDYGQICHVNVGKTMNLAIEGNVYIF